MKKFIVATVIATCLILCAAMWPQSEAVEEVSATPPPSVVASQSEMLEALEIEELIVPEEEKIEVLPLETVHDIIIEPDLTPDPMPTIPETQVIAEPAPTEAPMTPEIQPMPEPKSTPAPDPSQIVTDPQPGDMVYVPGFGWLECQGPGEVIYDENIHENGNKIGIMG